MYVTARRRMLPPSTASRPPSDRPWISTTTELYFSARCSTATRRVVANEMRRDSVPSSAVATARCVLDTFHDCRNGVLLPDQPARRPARAAVADEVHQHRELEHGVARAVGTLRRRLVGRDGHPVQVAALPRRPDAGLGHQLPARHPMEERVRLSRARCRRVRSAFRGSLPTVRWPATLVGLTTPVAAAQSRGEAVRSFPALDRPTPQPPARFATIGTGDVGVDFKYGLTRSLTADVTINTDFAQIEEDVQQVNLTRFSLLFPEKRDFFLEGQGIFAFCGRSLCQSRSGAATMCRSCSSAGRSVWPAV